MRARGSHDVGEEANGNGMRVIVNDCNPIGGRIA
jgi:hypothetical protein